MKKIFSLAALSALLYAMPMNASYYIGKLFENGVSVFFYNIMYAPIVLFPIFLILAIQTFLLRYYLKNISYPQAFLAVCAGNIPSTIIGALNGPVLLYSLAQSISNFIPIPFAIYVIMEFLLALTSSLLMIATLTIVFRYPVKKLIVPVVLGNIIADFIAITFILLITGGGCCNH